MTPAELRALSTEKLINMILMLTFNLDEARGHLDSLHGVIVKTRSLLLQGDSDRAEALLTDTLDGEVEDLSNDWELSEETP